MRGKKKKKGKKGERQVTTHYELHNRGRSSWHAYFPVIFNDNHHEVAWLPF